MQESYEFDGLEADGLAVRATQGLSFAALSDGYYTLLDNLQAQGVIEQKVFAFYLSDQPNPYTRTPGPSSSLTFGSWDTDKYALSDLEYISVDSSYGYWVVAMDEIKVNGQVVDTNANAIIDSGTSLIALSYLAYDKYHELICSLVTCEDSIDFTLFKCLNGEEQKLPEIDFVLDGFHFPITYQHYIYKEDGMCYTLLFPIDFPITILGDAFMRAYYTVFDADNSRIGLARSLNNPDSVDLWIVLPILLVTVVVLAGVLVCSCYLVKRRTKTLNPELMEPFIRTES